MPLLVRLKDGMFMNANLFSNKRIQNITYSSLFSNPIPVSFQNWIVWPGMHAISASMIMFFMFLYNIVPIASFQGFSTSLSTN